jgi:hypothetical protein
MNSHVRCDQIIAKKHSSDKRLLIRAGRGNLLSGLPDGVFHTKNADFVTFMKPLAWKILVHFLAIWYFYFNFLYIFSHLTFLLPFCTFLHYGLLWQEKSGNLAYFSSFPVGGSLAFTAFVI